MSSKRLAKSNGFVRSDVRQEHVYNIKTYYSVKNYANCFIINEGDEINLRRSG